MDVAGVEVAHENIFVDPSLDGPQPDGVEHASEEGLGVNSTNFISVTQENIHERVLKMFQ